MLVSGAGHHPFACLSHAFAKKISSAFLPMIPVLTSYYKDRYRIGPYYAWQGVALPLYICARELHLLRGSDSSLFNTIRAVLLLYLLLLTVIYTRVLTPTWSGTDDNYRRFRSSQLHIRMDGCSHDDYSHELQYTRSMSVKRM